MALTVLVADIQDRSGVYASAYEDQMDRLISRSIPVLEFALRDDVLGSADPGLIATLNDAAAEVIAGEFLGEHYRRPELLISVIIGDLQLFPRRPENPRDPSGMIASGWQKLRPWLKQEGQARVSNGVLSSPGKGVPIS